MAFGDNCCGCSGGTPTFQSVYLARRITTQMTLVEFCDDAGTETDNPIVFGTGRWIVNGRLNTITTPLGNCLLSLDGSLTSFPDAWDQEFSSIGVPLTTDPSGFFISLNCASVPTTDLLFDYTEYDYDTFFATVTDQFTGLWPLSGVYATGVGAGTNAFKFNDVPLVQDYPGWTPDCLHPSNTCDILMVNGVDYSSYDGSIQIAGTFTKSYSFGDVDGNPVDGNAFVMCLLDAVSGQTIPYSGPTFAGFQDVMLFPEGSTYVIATCTIMSDKSLVFESASDGTVVGIGIIVPLPSIAALAGTYADPFPVGRINIVFPYVTTSTWDGILPPYTTPGDSFPTP